MAEDREKAPEEQSGVAASQSTPVSPPSPEAPAQGPEVASVDHGPVPPGVPGSPWPPYGWYPPQPPAAPAGTPAWHGWLLVVITVFSAAAVALSALTAVRDDRGDLARDLAWELNDTSPEEEGFYGPTMSGMGPVSGGIAGCPEPLGGVADLGPRSPDETDPVVAAGETVVLRYDMLDCEQPVSFSLTVDNVRRQATAPEGGYPTRPRNGTYVVVDVTVQSPNYGWPDFLTFSIQGPDGRITTPLFSDSMFGVDVSEPGSPTTTTLVFDVTDGYDLVRFDDPGPGSVSWRI